MTNKKNRDYQAVATAEQALYAAIACIDTAEEARLFLDDLCTPAERRAMADRWRIVAPIKAEVPYRKVYETTGVSMTTIGRVARCIHWGNGGYNLIYQRMEQHDNSNTKITDRTAEERTAQ